VAGDEVAHRLDGDVGDEKEERPRDGPLRVREVDIVTKKGDVRASDSLESRFPQRHVSALGRFTVIR